MSYLHDQILLTRAFGSATRPPLFFHRSIPAPTALSGPIRGTCGTGSTTQTVGAARTVPLVLRGPATYTTVRGSRDAKEQAAAFTRSPPPWRPFRQPAPTAARSPTPCSPWSLEFGRRRRRRATGGRSIPARSCAFAVFVAVSFSVPKWTFLDRKETRGTRKQQYPRVRD